MNSASTTAFSATPARDPQLWRQARNRAKFKSHLFTYLTVNALLWAVWAATGRHMGGLPWPVFPTIFWGFGLAIQGLRTYGVLEQENLTEREYERLVKQRGGQ